jgi:PTS system mannose-specific IID component
MPQAVTVRTWTLVRVFLRTFFLQAGFSLESMQTLGLLYSLEPALRELYPEESARTEAVRRHLVPFNTHPYVAAGLVGGILFHEARVAAGLARPEEAMRFRQTLMGPLAALGDGFFWRSLRPAVGALSAALVPFIQGWAAVVFVVAYNLVHLTLRGRLFWLGWTLGDGLVSRVSAVRLPTWGNRLRTVAAGAAGGLGAWLAIRFGHQVGGHDRLALTVGALVCGLGTLVLAERGVRPVWLMYGLALAAVVAGWVH